MIVYIDKNDVPELDRAIIPSRVLRYIIEKCERQRKHFERLYSIYKNEFDKDRNKETDTIEVKANYAKYIVESIKGFYLGEPIKYDNNEKTEITADESTEISTTPTVKAKIDKKTGALVRHQLNIFDRIGERKIDISPLIDCFNHQTISLMDSKIGKYMGIFGEADEVLYATSKDTPEPRSTIYNPARCVLVQDNTVEHNDLFGCYFEMYEDIHQSKYWQVTVVTSDTEQDYRTTGNIDNFMFEKVNETRKHYFGGIPIIVYENNDEKQGDFEQVISLMDARNEFLSERLTDKKKFVDAILAIFGATLEEGSIEILNKEKFLDGIPEGARIEYIQKVFDEASNKILDDTLINDIHKLTMTVDMTDQNFAGNTTGVALKLKLMAMNTLVKSKMIAMQEGLKKRWLLYNNWLSAAGNYSAVSIDDVDIVFTVSMPVDEKQIVDMVCELKNADIVDDGTLLSLLWFVRDPAEALENLRQQKDENQKRYRDSFGITDYEKGNDNIDKQQADVDE